MIPGDLLSAFHHRQFHTLPGLLDSRAALPNSYPYALRAYAGRQLVPILRWSLVWPGREVNSRPTVREAVTLPTEPTRHGLTLQYETTCNRRGSCHLIEIGTPASQPLTLQDWFLTIDMCFPAIRRNLSEIFEHVLNVMTTYICLYFL